MDDRFQEAIRLLVDKSGGNQAEAARRMGVSKAYVSNVLAGKGPADPRTESWDKVRRALGRDSKPWMTREARSEYTADTRFQRLVDFMAALPPERRESFYTLARGLGFQED